MFTTRCAFMGNVIVKAKCGDDAKLKAEGGLSHDAKCALTGNVIVKTKIGVDDAKPKATS